MAKKIWTIGLDRALVLAGLYNAARPLGAGLYEYDPTPMMVAEAQRLLDQLPPGATYFRYIKGRVLKVDLSCDDQFDSSGYDENNGDNAADEVICYLQVDRDPNSLHIRVMHAYGLEQTLTEAAGASR